MNYENILFDIADGIARLTLNRPDKLNSFTVAMHTEVRDALARVEADGSVRVLVLTGAGRGFCAGQDLSDRAVAPGQAPVDLGQSIEKYYGPLVLTLRRLPLPVICAVNGGAARARTSRCCDPGTGARWRLSSCSALGPVPDTGGLVSCRARGHRAAMGLALGDKPAEQAAAWGLIWKCVDDDKLAADTDALARHFASAPTRGLARTKQAIYASPANTLAAQLDVERDLMRELGGSDDYREGVAAFLEKRAPKFTGK
jgi:2-(1,2-epoxy-1,2-dihydrophenyl)acetyl-CoA isomerase